MISWNYDFMDARMMLAESSHYALAREIIFQFVVVMEPQSWEKCAFSYFQLAHGHTQYTQIEYPRPRCLCMPEINIEKRKHYITSYID